MNQTDRYKLTVEIKVIKVDDMTAATNIMCPIIIYGSGAVLKAIAVHLNTIILELEHLIDRIQR